METNFHNFNIQSAQGISNQNQLNFGTFRYFKHQAKPDTFESQSKNNRLSDQEESNKSGLSKTKKCLLGLATVAVAVSAFVLGKKLSPKNAKEIEHKAEELKGQVVPEIKSKVEAPKVRDAEIIKPAEISPAIRELQSTLNSIPHRPTSKLITSSNFDEALKKLDVQSFGKTGLPLKYSHEQMVQDLHDCISKFPEEKAKTIVDDFRIKFEPKEDKWELATIPDLFAEVKTPEHQKVMEILARYTRENEVMVSNPELKNELTSFIKDVPEFAFVVGESQHGTHAFSVDSHTLQTLQKTLKYSEAAKLSDEQKEILKMSVLFHDFGKQFRGMGTPDSGHAALSRTYAEQILKRFDYTPEQKKRILNIVENHHWFKDYNQGNMSAADVKEMFGEDIEIAKAMARADLESINGHFHFKTLIRGRILTPEEYDSAMQSKMNSINGAKILSKTPSVVPERIRTPEEVAEVNETIKKLRSGASSTVELNIGGREVKATRFSGTQMGTNRAYLAEADGNLYYIKYPNGEGAISQSIEEALAAKLYRVAGVDAPNVELIYDKQGKVIGVASEYIPNLAGKPVETKHKYESFAVDAWLNNWDAPVVGNKLYTKNGSVIVDAGGSLRYRAQGGVKEYTNDVDSLYSLINYNRYHYHDMTKEDVLASVKHVTSLSDDTISQVFKELNINDPKLLDTVLKRKQYLKHFEHALPQISWGQLDSQICEASAKARKGMVLDARDARRDAWIAGKDNPDEIGREINISSRAIQPITSREEYHKTLEDVAKIHWIDGDICRQTEQYGTLKTRDHHVNIPYEMQGINLISGDTNFHKVINARLTGRPIPFEELYDERKISNITQRQIDDCVRCTEYSLGKVDKEFGKYDGIVYRGGYFSPEGGQYFSTSFDPKVIERFLYNDGQQVNVIKTKSGHKIYDVYAKYGRDIDNQQNSIAYSEMEILLSPDKKYRELKLDENLGSEMKEKIYALAEQLKKEAEKTVAKGSYITDRDSRYNKMSVDEIASEIKIWEEI